MWKIVSTFLVMVALIAGIAVCVYSTPTAQNPKIRTWYHQGHITPTQETQTIPLGYFELTVSPGEICANIGEQIEIRCSIYPLINTPIEISSVDVVLFDSYDSIIREQSMTMDSYWSASTVYTTVGDEAYYQLKVNFTFPYGEPGEHSEYGIHSFPILVKR